MVIDVSDTNRDRFKAKIYVIEVAAEKCPIVSFALKLLQLRE